jgi:putative ABC transport system substrate-binding protein
MFLGAVSKVLLAVAVLAAPLTAGAQSVGSPARVGVLCPGRCAGPIFEALREGLRDHGWVEPSTLVLEIREARGKSDRLPELARELVNLKPDVLVAATPQSALAAKDAAGSIPLVFFLVADPAGAGLVQSLAKPGGTVTGFTTLEPEGFIAKQVELLKEVVPGASRLAALMNPKNEVHRLQFPRQVPQAAKALGLQLQVLPVSQDSEIEPAIEAAVREQADILLVVGDALFGSPVDRIPKLALRVKLPAMYLSSAAVRAGGLVSYGADVLAIARQTAGYVDRILKGAKPGDLPVEQPTKYELVINMKTAKALDLTIPPSVLLRADLVIE